MVEKKEIQNFKTTIKTTIYALNIVWKERTGKALIVLQILYSIIGIFPSLILTVFSGLIIDELINEKNIYDLIFYVAFLLIVPVFLQLCKVIIEISTSKLRKSFDLKLTSNFYNHAMSVDYSTIENPNIQIVKERASDTLSKVTSVSSSVTLLLSSVIRLILISSIISTLNPFIILLVIFILIINSFVTKKINYKKHIVGKELSQNDRFLWAYTYMMGHFSYAKEIRLFDLKSLLIKTFAEFKSESDKKEIRMIKLSRQRDVILVITNFAQQLILYIYLILSVLFNGLSVGLMTIYMSTVGQFSSSLSSVFNEYLNLENISLNIQELMDFMSLPLRKNQNGDIIPNFNEESVIEFRNVSFKYPGSERYAVKKLNLSFKANEKLCIVGENGSGKTTFIKLLTRLYCPTEGEILLNGVSIDKYDYKKYQRLFSPVFQDFSRYYFTLRENIVLSDDYDSALLDEVIIQSGLNGLVNQLAKGYDTQVGKFLDEKGFEPSGGEDQRIAIARALYHGGEIFLLDEPTAALDPNAEYEIYTKFHNIIQDKCAVLITHRLSAVQLADKIAVFHNGSVVEYGTHKELYEKGGIYTEMFDKQAQFYRDEKSSDN